MVSELPRGPAESDRCWRRPLHWVGVSLWLLALSACCKGQGLEEAVGSSTTGGSSTSSGTGGAGSTTGGLGTTGSGGRTASSTTGTGAGSSTGPGSSTGAGGSSGGTGGICPADGGLATPTFYPAGLDPALVGAADFDGDGNLDLAVVNFLGGVSILPGAGNGTFGAPHSFAAQTQGSQGAIADWNLDGHPDLAASDLFDIYVLLNDGRGGLLPAVGYPVAQASQLPTDGLWIATGDFNGDGAPDIAFTQQFARLPGALSVLLNQGGGAFAAAVAYSAGSSPSYLTTADVNGDGAPDIVSADQEGDIEVLLNDGSGTFSRQESYAVATPADGLMGITAQDFNGDGLPDLASALLLGTQAVLLLSCPPP